MLVGVRVVVRLPALAVHHSARRCLRTRVPGRASVLLRGRLRPLGGSVGRENVGSPVVGR